MQRLSEKQLIQRLVQDEACLGDAISFVTSKTLNFGDEIQESILHIATEVSRELLGLELGKKPGDIDMLIVPENKNILYFERSVAIEVKVVRPTLLKPSKNAGKMGTKQIEGLVTDGFPFIGLLHLEIPEESPNSLKAEMPNDFMMDMFPLESAKRQFGRLNHLDLPDFVGFSSTGLQSLQSSLVGSTIGFDKNCKSNPFFKESIIESVKQLYESGSYEFTSHAAYG